MAEEGSLGGLLSGSVKTPFGEVKKSTAYIVGGSVIVLAILYYRSQQAKNAAASAGAPEIDPATGYPYGSPEDAAALQAQQDYNLSVGGSGGGGGGGGTTNTNPLNNAEWANSVIQYWRDNDLGDPTIMSAALGVYLAGNVPTAAQVDLIHQATALKGLPPNAGTNGYPPAINTGSPVTNPPPSDSNPGAHDEAHGYFTVKPGWHVSQWVTDVKAHPNGNPSATFESIDAMNGGAVSRNVKWSKDTTKTTFIRSETYRVR